MSDQTSIPARFVISKNLAGVTSIVDSTKKGNGKTGIIALFYKDPQWTARAEMYANVCVDALNAEAMRRTQKEKVS